MKPATQQALTHNLDVEEILARHPEIEVTAEQLACCLYLQRQGKRFLIDFGYENASAMVWSEIEADYACPDCGGCGSIEVRSDTADWKCRRCLGTGVYVPERGPGLGAD